MTALSLFSGIGGLDLAAHAAGIETVAFCEIEPFAVQVLERRLVRPTKGKDCSSLGSGAMWPTPSQRDYKGANGDAHFLSRERPHLSQLPNAVKVLEDSGPRPPAQSGARSTLSPEEVGG